MNSVFSLCRFASLGFPGFLVTLTNNDDSGSIQVNLAPKLVFLKFL